MNPINNPYAPGAGTPPPELAGRSEIINNALTALERLKISKPVQSQILVGLRGVGKTVLLNRIRQLAEDRGFHCESIEAHEGKALPELLAPKLRSSLYKLSTVENAKEIARQGFRIFKSFLNSVSISIGEMDIGLSVEPEHGTADSGDLEADLPELFLIIGKVAQKAGKPVAIFIDELQYLSSKEFSALIMAIHRTNQDGLPIILIGAGLPQILGLAGNSKSYAERLFQFPRIGALQEQDAQIALKNPAINEGVAFEDEAIKEVLRLTESYPYFLQQWAYEAWNIAQGNCIGKNDVLEASYLAINKLDQDFFRVRFERCTPKEKEYMRALAELGKGEHRSGDIAEILRQDTKKVAMVRANLIKKGMLYAPSHGNTAFTVPMFDQYMKRVMPQLEV